MNSADIRQLAAFAKVLAKGLPAHIPARGRRVLSSGNLAAKVESAVSLCLDKEFEGRWSDCVCTTGITPMPIEADDLVDEVMRSRPTTIRVFLDFKMNCVGCPIACFHTVNDSCIEHGVDRSEFLAALREAESIL